MANPEHSTRLPTVASSADTNGTTEAAPISLKRAIWPLTLSLAVMCVIGYFTFEVVAFRKMMSYLNPVLLGVALSSVALRVFFGGWRLSFISQGKLNMMAGMRGQLAWDFFSNITPSTVGGGPIAAGYIAHDRNIPLGEATAIMLFSMLLDQFWFALSIPLILAVGLFLEIIPASLGSIGAWSFTLYFIGLMVWVLVFSYATLFRPILLERLTDRLFQWRFLRRFHEGAMREVGLLRERAVVLRSQSLGFYIKGFLLTLGTWINRYALIVFIIWSVYPSLDKLLTFFRSIALTLGSLVLPTPGGSGGLEGLYALFMGPLMPEALVAPTLLTWRILGYYIFIALGAFLSMHHVQRSLRGRKKQPELITQGDGHPAAEPVLTSEPVE